MALNVRGFAKALMPNYVAMGLSSRAIERDLKSRFGVAYRRTVLLSDLREATGMYRFQAGVQALRPSTIIPKTLMTETTLRRERRYKVHAKVTIKNRDTGEEEESWVSMYDDSLRSKGEYEQAYYDRQLTDTSRPEWEVVHFSINVVEHNQGWQY